MAGTPPPDYGDGFPEMSENTWVSDPTFNLGKISGLFKMGNATLHRMFGMYDFHLDRNNPLNFENLNLDTFKDDGNSDPSVYIYAWIAVSILFVISGLVWCSCNKCCCCCTSRFRDKQDFDDDYESQGDKSGKPSRRVIAVSIIMAVWLTGYLLIIVLTFASNEKAKGTFDLVETGIDSAVKDFNNYLFTSVRQLVFTFVDEFNENLSPRILQSVVDMECGDDVDLDECEEMKEELYVALEGPLGETGNNLNQTSTSLSNALKEVQDELNETKVTLDSDIEDIMTKIITALYAAFMVLNVIYLLIFTLVLVGTILATFGKRRSMKIKGHLINRGAVVLMFIFFAVCVLQFLVMFIFSGLLSEIICPAVRELEEEPPPTTESPNSTKFQFSYNLPSYDKIMRACKKDESAYSAFKLEEVYNLDNLHDDLVGLFDNLKFSTPRNTKFSAKNGTVPRPGKSPEDTIHNIKTHVSDFSDFAAKVARRDIGKCFPAFNAINSTITLFCHKVPAPVTAFWWILQFIPVIFFLLIVTSLIFEQVQT